MEKEEANLPSAPSSSSTTTDLHHSFIEEPRPNSRPDLLRQVQAALKRNRPIGTMQSSNIRPRRILLPQREPSRIPASTSADIVDYDNSQGVRLKEERKNASATGVDARNMDPIGVQKAENNDLFEHKGDNVGSSSHFVHQPVSASDSQKKVQFSLGNNAFCQQSEYDVNNLVEMPPINDHHKQQQDTQEMEVFDMGMSDGGISSLLAKRSMLMQNPFLGKEINQPMNQSSVVASSCMTTISVHSKSAPALNSTTYNSRPCQDISSHMDIEPIEERKVDPQAMSQAYPQQLLCPTYQCTSGMLVDSSAAPTQMSVSSLVSTVGPKDHGKQGLVSKDSDMLVAGLSDHAKGSSALQDQSNKEKGHPGDVTDVQSQAPMTKSSCTSIKTEPSKSDKHEKAAGSKGGAGPRKKNHDSDVFVKVNGKLYQKLGKIGSGGSSEVYKVISSDCTIYALKRIKLKGRDYSTAYGFCQEVEYLNKLRGKNNIIQLIDYEVTDKTLLEEVMNGSMNIKDGRIREDGYIYMVLEYGEIDLAHMLSQKWKEQDSSSWTMDENWLRFYWQQILQAVNTIHEERIVHSDLKPANFLLVKGALKLIDFGIAKAIMSDTTNIQRDSQVGTLSYMSPEAFMCNENDSNGNAIKCGRPSDIWSLGCILYQMVYGRTPFSEYKTFWAKFKVITDRNHKIIYEPVSNPWLLDLMKKCLAWERNDRWRIPQLLQHPFLVPPVTPSPQNERFELFEQIVETCGKDDEEVGKLCSELQLLIRGSNGGASSQHSILRDLSHISSLWSQLQQHLKDIEWG